MRNLWIFLSKYNAFFLFVIFFIIGLILTIRNNIYQKSMVFNSANQVIGQTYERLNVINRFLSLTGANDSLAKENANLRNKIFALTEKDSSKLAKIVDSNYHQQYTMMAARVIKNSISLTDNIITINKGSNNGIEKDMAVISAGKGVVGFVQKVTPNYSTIRSLLNSETSISVILKKEHTFGSLVWGNHNLDYRKAYVKEIPNHIKIKVGDTVITSGAGGFPKGIEVGKISHTGISTGDSFMTLELSLFNDFSTLQYVYIIKDKFAEERKSIENTIEK